MTMESAKCLPRTGQDRIRWDKIGQDRTGQDIEPVKLFVKAQRAECPLLMMDVYKCCTQPKTFYISN